MRLVALCLLLLCAPAWGQGSRDFQLDADYLQVASALITGPPATFACWFNPDSTNDQRMMYASNSGSSGDFLALYGSATQKLQCFAHDGASLAEAPGTWSTGTWHHGACVFVSDSSRFGYLDGAVGTENTVSKPLTGVSHFSIGRAETDTPTTDIDAQLAHCAAYSAALGAGEVADLAGGKSPLLVRRGSLVVYCGMQEGVAGDNCLDLSGNGNDLTQTGSPPPIADSPPIYIPGPPP